jgi:tRNA pseudouridine38-40 synthase
MEETAGERRRRGAIMSVLARVVSTFLRVNCLTVHQVRLSSLPMSLRAVQLVLHYDGTRFAGWQRQPDQRTVQGVLEEALARLGIVPSTVIGAGRTDAGVHARGQAAGVRVTGRWTAHELRRALNAILSPDVWIAAAFEMRPEFHARFSAIARRYSYYIGTDDEAASPFRRSHEWQVVRPIDGAQLDVLARMLIGEHVFRAFAVRGTAPASDEHRCDVREAAWHVGPGQLRFDIEANRFLHHMVRFLVGTMIDIATGRRAPDTLARLLVAAENSDVSPPAPAHALFLEAVRYPSALYLAAP